MLAHTPLCANGSAWLLRAMVPPLCLRFYPISGAEWSSSAEQHSTLPISQLGKTFDRFLLIDVLSPTSVSMPLLQICDKIVLSNDTTLALFPLVILSSNEVRDPYVNRLQTCVYQPRFPMVSLFWDDTHGFIIIPMYPLWLFCTLFRLSFSVLISQWTYLAQPFSSDRMDRVSPYSSQLVHPVPADPTALPLTPIGGAVLHPPSQPAEATSSSPLTPVGGAVLPLQILDIPDDDDTLAIESVIFDVNTSASSCDTSPSNPNPPSPEGIFLNSSDEEVHEPFTFPPVPPPVSVPEVGIPTILSEETYHEVAITAFHTMKQESATWLFSSVDTLEEVGRKCTAVWNIEFRFELCQSPLRLDQPVVLHDPTITRHPGLTIIPVKIIGPPRTPPNGSIAFTCANPRL